MIRIKTLLLTILLMLPFAAAIGVPASYERAIANILVSEGYTYTNTAGDPGGPTKYGITIYDVRKYLLPNATASDVRALTLPEAKEIYRVHYWDAVSGDTLPAGLDYTVADYAVNAGDVRALATLRACTAMVPKPPAPVVAPGPTQQQLDEIDNEEYHIEWKAHHPPSLWQRIKKYFTSDAKAAELVLTQAQTIAAIKCVNDKRMAYQMGLGHWADKFKKGWRNRIKSVRNISLSMAGGKPASADIGIDLYSVPRIGMGKAYEEGPNVMVK